MPNIWQILNDQLVLDRERNLFRDLEAKDPIRTLLVGTRLTVLQGSDGGGGWARVRTADGDEGYIFVDEEQARHGIQDRPTATAAKTGCLLLLAGLALITILAAWEKHNPARHRV